METKLRIVCVIPARLKSARFPEKMLSSIAGKPLLKHVWDAAHATGIFADIVIAGDSQKINDLVDSFQGKYVATSPNCSSGTDRLIEVMQQGTITGDIWVNWQGDEPLISKDMIETLIQTVDDHRDDMWTLKKQITIPAHITSANIAKVVCDGKNHALYFSRSPIPFVRDEQDLQTLANRGVYFKHVGIYAFRTKTLEKIASMQQTDLEDAEKLEQLRFLHHGISIRVHETNREVVGVDTVDDLHAVEAIIFQ